MIVQKWLENQDKVRQAGEIALKAARQAGVPIYYKDPALGPGIVKEMPDGTRHVIEVDGDRGIVRATFGPRS